MPAANGQLQQPGIDGAQDRINHTPILERCRGCCISCELQQFSTHWDDPPETGEPGFRAAYATGMVQNGQNATEDQGPSPRECSVL